mmetsp:Transcript_11324/g.24389  ORF Transcript_11324/g.24389 Transcript_11324/m.24389 type:complete len:118 (+) Transcript_11324:129-482(+)
MQEQRGCSLSFLVRSIPPCPRWSGAILSLAGGAGRGTLRSQRVHDVKWCRSLAGYLSGSICTGWLGADPHALRRLALQNNCGLGMVCPDHDSTVGAEMLVCKVGFVVCAPAVFLSVA